MLAKKDKLAKKDFPAIYKRGRRIGNHFFNFIFLPNRTNFSRFAVVINKKTAKLATQRNKTRRIVFGLIYDNFNKFPKGLNIAIYCRQTFSSKSKQEFIDNFLKATKYLNEKNSPRAY